MRGQPGSRRLYRLGSLANPWKALDPGGILGLPDHQASPPTRELESTSFPYVSLAPPGGDAGLKGVVGGENNREAEVFINPITPQALTSMLFENRIGLLSVLWDFLCVQ